MCCDSLTHPETACSKLVDHGIEASRHAVISCGYGKETASFYLLSDNIGVMACLDFEGAVIGP